MHSDAPSTDATDWAQILALYDLLLRIAPSDVVRLNRAVALAEVSGPADALDAVDALTSLQEYHLWHATRADLLARQGRDDEAAAAYDAALARTENEAERAFLRERREALSDR